MTSIPGAGIPLPATLFRKKPKIMITKKLLITAFTGLSLFLPLSAVTVDTDTFGEALNGWRKNRTASYSIDNHNYLTHKPTVTPNPGGGIFVSTRIEHNPKFGKKTTSYIELSYSSAGTLLTAQIRMMAGDLGLNTSLISRPVLTSKPLEGEEAVTSAEPWTSPEGSMVIALFKSLDAEFASLTKKREEGKKDVFSRVFGRGYQSADLSAAIRHNLNLLLKYTG
jgi:hypothetical protein